MFFEGALNFADDFAGIANGDRVGRDILDNHATSSDRSIVPDAYSWAYNRSATDPHIITDRDWGGKFYLNQIWWIEFF